MIYKNIELELDPRFPSKINYMIIKSDENRVNITLRIHDREIKKTYAKNMHNLLVNIILPLKALPSNKYFRGDKLLVNHDNFIWNADGIPANDGEQFMYDCICDKLNILMKQVLNENF